MLSATCFALLALACGEASRIQGTVVDNFGKPIGNASVEVKGSQFVAKTDESGAFTLDYAPGQFVVRAHHEPAYLDNEVPLNISQKVAYKLAPIVLTVVPPNDGLRIAVPGDYTLVPSVPLPTTKHLDGPFSRCLEKRFPPDAASFKGDVFMAFAPASERRDLGFIQTEDKVLVSQPLGLMANCARGVALVTGLKWNELGERVQVSGKLRPGLYCLARLPVNALLGRELGDEAACFRWNKDDPTAAIRPLLSQIRAGLAAQSADALGASSMFPLAIRDIAYGDGPKTVGSAVELKQAIAEHVLTADVAQALTKDQGVNFALIEQAPPPPVRAMPDSNNLAWYRLFLDRREQEYTLTLFVGFAPTAPNRVMAFVWQKDMFGGD